MQELFEKCLKAKYTHTAESGEYAIEVEDVTLYLLFEWSNGVEDWKNNFDFPAGPYKDMSAKWLCHRGFTRVWKAMRDEVVNKVTAMLSVNSNIENIVCVGYSHGGALAVLATEDMAYRYGAWYKVSGYGFGAPRVMWGKIPYEVKTRLKHFYTVRNIPDLVTHVPPMLFGFRNAGHLCKIGEKGKYRPIQAHHAEAYIEELEDKESKTD